MISTLLIANRGEIARRIMRTAARVGMRTVAVHSDADADAAFVRDADVAVRIGPAPARDSYLKIDAVLDAAKATGADAIHPGYGFLSENAEFAEACASAGVIFVGPSPAAMRAMGRKDQAKTLMEAAGVPVTPGYHGADQSEAVLKAAAKDIGYPVLIKAVSGGGGKGMRKVDKAVDFSDALASCQREAAASFGDDRVLVEKFITGPRHIEVQVFGDSLGRVVHLYERDCSLQRRHQKVIEEAPAPGMTETTRAAMCAAAIKAARAVDYVGAGTVEFIVDGSKGLRPDGFWFMEMNTRLQVEHPVTEMVTGLDLVELQLRIASGEALPRQEDITLTGHAVEARIYAEDPATGFLPSIGMLEVFEFAPAFSGGWGDDDEDSAATLRLDSAVEEGDEVSPHYDPMIAKAIAHAPTRDAALAALADGLRDTRIWPVRTNTGFLVRALAHDDFRAAKIDTSFIETHFDALVPAVDADEVAAIAATAEAVAGEASRAWATPHDPWLAGDGWRLNGPSRIWRAYDIGGERRDVVTTPTDGGYDVTVGERLFVATPTAWSDAPGGGELELVLDGETRSLGVTHTDDGLVLFENGCAIEVGAPHPEAAAEALEGGDEVKAPMPGKVLEVRVADGETVEAGQKMLVLEAMKMEHALTAPRAGVVETVLVKAGAQVKDGAVLVRLAAED